MLLWLAIDQEIPIGSFASNSYYTIPLGPAKKAMERVKYKSNDVKNHVWKNYHNLDPCQKW